jgi:hypothetical protein
VKFFIRNQTIQHHRLSILTDSKNIDYIDKLCENSKTGAENIMFFNSEKSEKFKSKSCKLNVEAFSKSKLTDEFFKNIKKKNLKIKKYLTI